MNVDFLSLNIRQLDVAMVALQHRTDGFQHRLDFLDLFDDGQFLRGRLRRLRRRRASGRRRDFAGTGSFSLHFGENFFDAFVSGGATTTGLGIKSHLLDGIQIIGLDHVLNHHGVDGEALADQRTFFMVIGPFLAAIIGDGSL